MMVQPGKLDEEEEERKPEERRAEPHIYPE